MNKKTKRITVSIIIFIGIITAITYVFYINNDKYNNTVINTTIELQKVNQQEYEQDKTMQLHSRENLRKLYVKVEVLNSKKCKSVEIIIPELNEIDYFGQVRTVSGGSSSINNKSYKMPIQSIKYIIFDSTDMSETDIRNIYKGLNVQVNIITSEEKNISNSFDIGEGLIMD